MDASEIEKTVVVGGGLMGAGFAQILAGAGCHVFVVDLTDTLLERCLQRLEEGLATFVENELISRDEVCPMLGRVEAITSLERATVDAQFVVEAVTEKLDVKQELFERLGEIAPPDAILATNTSGLSVGDIALRARHPERAVGSHFFYPNTLMPLVEVGYGPHTSDGTVKTTVAFWRRCAKVPVVCRKDSNGFLANRLQSALVREAASLVARGVASAGDVDRALRFGLGIRMPLWGPLEQRDWSGIDVHSAAAAAIYPTLEDSKTPLPIMAEKVARGETGVRAGKGFYDWTGKDVDALWRQKQSQLVRMVRAVREIVPEEDGLVENEA